MLKGLLVVLFLEFIHALFKEWLTAGETGNG
jgi:hypothetical protein